LMTANRWSRPIDCSIDCESAAAALPRQFDEYIWLDKTNAVTPLRSRELERLPDAYPFGLRKSWRCAKTRALDREPYTSMSTVASVVLFEPTAIVPRRF